MNARDLLERRNYLLASIAEVDDRLVELSGEKPTNRVVAEFRHLTEVRLDLADEIRALNAEPPPLPLHPQETTQP